EAAQAHLLDDFRRAASVVARRQSLRLRTEHHVLHDRQPRKQRRLLEYDGAARRWRQDFLAGDTNAAAGRMVESGHHVEERGLAAAGRTQDGDELALGHGEADVFQREHAPLAFRELLRYAIDLDHACASSVRQRSTRRLAQTMTRSDRKPSRPT